MPHYHLHPFSFDLSTDTGRDIAHAFDNQLYNAASARRISDDRVVTVEGSDEYLAQYCFNQDAGAIVRVDARGLEFLMVTSGDFARSHLPPKVADMIERCILAHPLAFRYHLSRRIAKGNDILTVLSNERVRQPDVE